MNLKSHWVSRFFPPLWFCVLALLFNRPLIWHATDKVAGQIGDNIYFIWMIGWVEKALFTLHTNPLNVWFLNYPEGWNLARTEMAPAQLLSALPFSLIGGETFAFNMVMLVSFALSGWIMYGWVKHLTGSRIAGLISGTIFACLPYRQAHFLAGHLNLAGTQWLPLFFWGWFDLLKTSENKIHPKAALFAALGLGFTAMCSQYYFFMAVLLAGIIAVIVLLFFQRGNLRKRSFWASIGLFTLFVLPLLLLAELPFILLAGSGGLPDRDWGSVRAYSASLTDFLLPATTHFLFGNWVGTHFNRDYWIEATLFTGFSAIALTFFAFLKRTKKEKALWVMLISGIAISFILALGTDLHWNAQPVELHLPQFLSEMLNRESIPLFLPGIFMFKFFPFYAKIRAMMRFGLFCALFLSVSAGFGASLLTKKLTAKKQVFVTVLLLVAVLFEFYPKPIPTFSPIESRPVDFWLQSQPDNSAVMRIPFELNDDQAATFATLTHEKPFIGGFFNAFPTNQYTRIRAIMESFPTTESLRLARELGVGYFLLETKAIEESGGNAQETILAFDAAGLLRSAEWEDVIVYQFEN